VVSDLLQGSSCTATAQTPCAEGTFTAITNQPSCAACGEGKYANAAIGATGCDVCAARTFNAATGKTVCATCVAGRTNSGATAITQQLCDSCATTGYYRPYDSTTDCQPCDIGS
jgi:hypothetical protein